MLLSTALANISEQIFSQKQLHDRWEINVVTHMSLLLFLMSKLSVVKHSLPTHTSGAQGDMYRNTSHRSIAEWSLLVLAIVTHAGKTLNILLCAWNLNFFSVLFIVVDTQTSYPSVIFTSLGCLEISSLTFSLNVRCQTLTYLSCFLVWAVCGVWHFRLLA